MPLASLLLALSLLAPAAACAEEDTCMLQLGRADEVQQAPTSVFVGIKSAPLEFNQERRNNWRKVCAPKYKKAGWQYKFFVGMPWDHHHDLTEHKHDGHDTKLEVRLQKALMKEVEEFQDVELLPMRDCYQDLSNKLIGLFRYGVLERKEKYIMEQDDDVCGVVDEINRVIRTYEKRDDDTFLYAGRVLDNRQVTVGPYYWGMISLVSRGLAELVFVEDYTHTVLNGAYGSNEDDTNFGLWVKHAMDHHGVKVSFETDKAFTSDEAVKSAQMDQGTVVMSLAHTMP